MEKFGIQFDLSKFEVKKPKRQDLIDIFVEKINDGRKGGTFAPLKSDYDVKQRTRLMTNIQLAAFLADCEKSKNFGQYFYSRTNVK